MKHHHRNIRRWSLTCLLVLASAAIFLSAPSLSAEDVSPSEADAAWAEVQTALKPPVIPPEWAGKPLSSEQQAEFKKLLAARSAAAAQKLKEFQERFPGDQRVPEARDREKRMLQQAVQYGDADSRKALDPLLSTDEKARLRVEELHRKVMQKSTGSMAVMMEQLEAGTRELLREFPSSDLVWQQFLLIAKNSPPENAQRVLKEFLDADGPSPELKKQAQAMLKKYDAIGLPLEMSFTSMDGRAVDVQKLKGKVVLIDFWATWCAPCIVSLPEVKRIYDAYHDRGLEIIGISLDKDQRALDSFLERESIEWPQYFDGGGWGTKWSMAFSISAIPTMYLVDKQGLLRYTDATDQLEKKIKELLAEK